MFQVPPLEKSYTADIPALFTSCAVACKHTPAPNPRGGLLLPSDVHGELFFRPPPPSTTYLVWGGGGGCVLSRAGMQALKCFTLDVPVSWRPGYTIPLKKSSSAVSLLAQMKRRFLWTSGLWTCKARITKIHPVHSLRKHPIRKRSTLLLRPRGTRVR